METVLCFLWIYLYTILYEPVELRKYLRHEKALFVSLAMMGIFYFCGIIVTYYSTTAVASLVRPLPKTTDKPFEREFVDFAVAICSQ